MRNLTRLFALAAALAIGTGSAFANSPKSKNTMRNHHSMPFAHTSLTATPAAPPVALNSMHHGNAQKHHAWKHSHTTGKKTTSKSGSSK